MQLSKFIARRPCLVRIWHCLTPFFRRTHSLIYFQMNAQLKITEEQSDSELEATVMKFLSHSTAYKSATESEEPNSSVEPPKRQKRRKKRPSKVLVKSNETDMEALRKSIADSAKKAEQRAVALAVVQPRTSNAASESFKIALRPENSNAVPVIMHNTIDGKHGIVGVGEKGSGILKRRRRGDVMSQGDDQNKVAMARVETGNEVDAMQFVDKHRREVGRFGSRALGKRDRKRYDTAELVKLGCRRPKNQKMPIGVLEETRKYIKMKEAQKKEMDLASGMLVRSKRR